MKVLHVISGLGNGGAEATLFRLVQGTPDCEHSVVSLSSRGRYAAQLELLGVRVISLASKSGWSAITALPALGTLVSNFRPDIIQGWMYHGNLAASVIGAIHPKAAVVWGVRHSNLVVGIDRRRTIWVSRICAKISPWLPKAVIFAGYEAERAHRSVGYRAKKMVVIPNGFDLTHLRPDAKLRRQTRKALGLHRDDFVIGSVARFVPQKDHRTLFAALGRLREKNIDFRCVLVGPGIGRDNEQLVNLARAFEIEENLLYLGSVAEVKPVMVSFDLLVSSSAFGEAFPNVLAEAMSCGTPCVATNVGDSGEIIGKFGWLVQNSDVAALEKGLSVAYAEFKDKLAWNGRSIDGRKRIKTLFALEKMLSAYRSIWAYAINPRGEN